MDPNEVALKILIRCDDVINTHRGPGHVKFARLAMAAVESGLIDDFPLLKLLSDDIIFELDNNPEDQEVDQVVLELAEATSSLASWLAKGGFQPAWSEVCERFQKQVAG